MSKTKLVTGKRKTQIPEYFADALAYWGDYHNHKETSAWASLVLFIVFASAVPNFLERLHFNTPLKLGVATFFVLVIWLAIHWHVRKQFWLLARGGVLTHAYLFLYAQYLSGISFHASDFKPKNRKRPRTESEWSTPSIVEKIIEDHTKQGVQPRITIALLIHLLIAVTGATLMAIIWAS